MDVVEEAADGRTEDVEPRLRDRMAWKKPLLLLSMELEREKLAKAAISLCDFDLLIVPVAAAAVLVLVPVVRYADTGEASCVIGDTGVRANVLGEG